jgi:hypothetical protein
MKYFVLVFIALAVAAQTSSTSLIKASTGYHRKLAEEGFAVSFAAHPPDPTYTRCHWWFGDMIESDLCTVTHSYTREGVFPVHLRMATADEKNQAAEKLYVRVSLPVEFLTPEQVRALSEDATPEKK